MLEDFIKIECAFTDYDGQVAFVIVSEKILIDQISEIIHKFELDNAVLADDELIDTTSWAIPIIIQLSDLTNFFEDNAIVLLDNQQMMCLALPDYKEFMRILVSYGILNDYYVAELFKTYHHFVF